MGPGPKVAVIRRVFLRSMNRTFRAVDIKDQIGALVQALPPVNPLAAKIRQCRQVLVAGQGSRLKPEMLCENADKVRTVIESL